MSNRKRGKAWRCKRELTYPKGEGWKTIPSFPDYMVNKEGQVWDLRTGRHRKVSKTPRSDGNYLSVILINDTGSHTRSLACLLDEAFQEKVWLSPYPEHYNITNRSKVSVPTPNAPVEYKVVKTVTETISVYPYLKDLNYPVSLAHKPTSQLISYSNNGSRSTYVADRTRALLLLFSAVKSRNFTVPMFDPKDDMAPQLELLNEIEKPQTLESNSNVYLLQKVASKYDDCCFACAIGNLCMCDVTKAYPTFTMDTRYEMSPQQIEAVYGPDNEFMG